MGHDDGMTVPRSTCLSLFVNLFRLRWASLHLGGCLVPFFCFAFLFKRLGFIIIIIPPYTVKREISLSTKLVVRNLACVCVRVWIFSYWMKEMDTVDRRRITTGQVPRARGKGSDRLSFQLFTVLGDRSTLCLRYVCRGCLQTFYGSARDLVCLALSVYTVPIDKYTVLYRDTHTSQRSILISTHPSPLYISEKAASRQYLDWCKYQELQRELWCWYCMRFEAAVQNRQVMSFLSL